MENCTVLWFRCGFGGGGEDNRQRKSEGRSPWVGLEYGFRESGWK